MSKINVTSFKVTRTQKYRVWGCLPRSRVVNHEADSCFQASLCQHSSYTLTSHHISGAIEVLLNGPFTSGCRNHNLAISVLNKRFYVMLSPYNSQPKWGEKKIKSLKKKIFFWPYPQHTEVPMPGIKPTPQQRPKPLQWQCQIHNLLSHKGTPYFFFHKSILKTNALRIINN